MFKQFNKKAIEKHYISVDGGFSDSEEKKFKKILGKVESGKYTIDTFEYAFSSFCTMIRFNLYVKHFGNPDIKCTKKFSKEAIQRKKILFENQNLAENVGGDEKVEIEKGKENGSIHFQWPEKSSPKQPSRAEKVGEFFSIGRGKSPR